MLRHDYGVVVFLLQSITVVKWPCLVSVLCETVYIRQGLVARASVSNWQHQVLADGTRAVPGRQEEEAFLVLKLVQSYTANIDHYEGNSSEL